MMVCSLARDGGSRMHALDRGLRSEATVFNLPRALREVA